MALLDDPAPTSGDIAVLARAAGFAVDQAEAARIAASIGPALRGFQSVAGTLPFDLEPSTFTRVQNGAGT